MTATASSEALTESGVQASSAQRRERSPVNSRAWQAVAVAVGVALLAVTALDVAGIALALGELPLETAHAPMESVTEVVTRVTHPGAIAGVVRVGDRVGLADRSLGNRLALRRQRAGDRFAFTGVRPNGAPVSFVATLQAAPMPGVATWVYQLLRIVLIAAGVLVAVRRPADGVARMLAMFFFSIAALIEVNGPLTPIWLAGIMLLVVTPFAEIFAAYAALAIAVAFPQPSVSGPRAVLARANPWLLGALLALQWVGVAFEVLPARPALTWIQPLAAALSFVYFAAIAVAFTIAHRTAAGGDKQRVAWIWSSVAVGFSGPLITLVIVLAHVPLVDWMQYLGLTLLAIPIGLGYAILRHRVVDVGFVLNRALVFGTVSGLVLLAFGALEWLLGNVLVRNLAHHVGRARARPGARAWVLPSRHPRAGRPVHRRPLLPRATRRRPRAARVRARRRVHRGAAGRDRPHT